MGLSNFLGGGAQEGGAATGDGVKKPDFGDKLGSYFESKFPVAGGLADMVFGNKHQPSGDAPVVAPASAPMTAMPSAGAPDSSIISMNAQPQSGGGGLATLIKLFAA